MFDTPTPTSESCATPQPIIDRIATPLLAFSTALVVLMVLTRLFFVPRFTSISVADVTLSPSALQSYVQKMKADVMTMEQKRDRLVLPLQDKTYTQAKTERQSVSRFENVRTGLRSVAISSSDVPDAITIATLSYDRIQKSVTLTGDVSKVGPRSMTVLATFVDGVAALPFVADVKRPAFTREQATDGSFHSPFTMTLILR